MPSFFGFGATGLRGEACPVPAADGVIPWTFRPETHDAWCNCMYSSDPALLYLCKIKFGDNLPNGDVFLDPGMPWTVTGKRTRGLENDALGRALQQILHAANQAVTNATRPDDFDTVADPHQAQPVGPNTQPSPNLQSAREAFYLMPQGGATQLASRVRDSVQNFDLSVSDESSKKLLLGGAIALGMWWFFKDQPRAVSGFGGYRRRRRSRR